MATIKEPAAEIAPLPNADGSVIFSYAGFKVIAAANGPVETLKREEYAYEALVDVIVRPAAGVGGQNLTLSTPSRLVFCFCPTPSWMARLVYLVWTARWWAREHLG